MTNAQTFDIRRHLLSNPGRGRVADVAICLRSQERIFPMALGETAAAFATNVASHAPVDLLLQAIADIWMPTKRVFVQVPSGPGAVGLFAEVQEDVSVDLTRLEADGQEVTAAPFIVNLRPAYPRPNVDWAGIKAGQWGDTDPDRWTTWLRECVWLTCHDRRIEHRGIKRWADEHLVRDLFTLVFALSFIGRRTIHATRVDGSEIPMDGGHA